MKKTDFVDPFFKISALPGENFECPKIECYKEPLKEENKAVSSLSLFFSFFKPYFDWAIRPSRGFAPSTPPGACGPLESGPPAVFFLKIMNFFFLKYITKTILGTLLSNMTGIDNIRIKRLGETQGDQDKLKVTKI